MSRIVEGKVVSGLGEGAKYVTMPVYNILLTELLDDTPYPGTLNIDIQRSYEELLSECPPLQIKSVVMNGHEYGGFYYWFGNIVEPNIHVLVIRPFLTKHPENVLEVVAEKNLRKELGLRDGSVIKVKLICAEV